MFDDKVKEEIENLSTEAISRLAFSNPWQDGAEVVDPDGFSLSSLSKEEIEKDREALQTACWSKFFENPQVNTSTRGLVGRIVGSGFEVLSEERRIQKIVKDTIFDKRNKLYHFLPIYVTRNILEGELFLSLTLHDDGFTEVDFIDPSNIDGLDNGNTTTEGIVYHPDKPGMDLVFNIKVEGKSDIQIPSINLAYFPELLAVAKKAEPGVKNNLLKSAKSNKKKFKKLGGFKRFIVYWNRGLLTNRSTGHLRTTLKWLNRYENLKEYEIDHKKSSGSYVWAFEFDDIKAFKLWMSLTEEERRKTGIMAKMTPGGKMILPPGMKMKAANPTLPNISDSDTDILHMITAGLNEPEDISTGNAKGTFASVKASRAPMSDRTADEIEYFNRFFIYDFWGAVFFLRSTVTSFPKVFKIKEAVDFDDNQEPIFEKVKYSPEELIKVSYPTSELVDYEGRAKGFLGVKHGSTNTSLGVPNALIAKKMGISNYAKARLDKATEDEKYPELIEVEDQEATQEKSETEPAKGKKSQPAKPKAKVKE